MSTDTHAYSDLDSIDTNNHTRIAVEEIHRNDYWRVDFRYSQKKAYYKYLNQINDGKTNGKRHNDEYETRLGNEHLIECLDSSLHLNQKSISEAKNLIHYIDLQREGLRIEKVAYAVCAFVVHSSDVDTRKTHPQTELPEEFERMKRELNISDNEFEKTYGKVQYQYQQYRRSDTVIQNEVNDNSTSRHPEAPVRYT